MVQWLRFHAANAGGVGSILGQRTKIPHTAWCSQKVKIIIKIIIKTYVVCYLGHVGPI